MAPEILLETQRIPTKESDIWAAGCTISEIYSDKYTWQSATEDYMKYHLLRQAQPDLFMVPQILRNLVYKFFAYEPS